MIRHDLYQRDPLKPLRIGMLACIVMLVAVASVALII